MITEADSGNGAPAEDAPKPKRKRTKKQPDLGLEGKGVAVEVHADVEEAADEYEIARDERIAKSKIEKPAKVKLLAAMKAHQLKLYKYDGKVVTIEAKDETVKVKKVGDDEYDVNVDDDE